MTRDEILELRDKILNPLTIIVASAIKIDNAELSIKIQTQVDRIDKFLKQLEPKE